MRARIYVAGPYTKGDVAANTSNAIRAGNQLADLGYAPFVPHLTHFWHIQHQRPYQFWCDLDNEFLPFCDGLVRLPGESSGSDAEVALANRLAIPVFHSIEELDQHFTDIERGENN